MKKLYIYILIIFSLFSCFKDPKEDVNKFLNDIKLKKIEHSKKYLYNPEMIEYIDFKYKNETQKIFIDELLKNFEFEVQDTVKREDRTEVVNVKINNIDVREVFMLIYKSLFKKTFQGEKNLNIKDVFVEILNSGNIPKNSIISQFLIIKDGKEKKILLRKENLDDIFGKYFSILNEINNE